MRRDRLRLSARRVRSLGTTHHRRLRRGFDLCGELRDSRLGESARALRLRRLSLGGGDVVIRRRGDRRVFSLATKRLLRGRRQTFDVAFHVRLLGLEFGDAFAKKRRWRVGGVLGVCVSVSDGASFRRDVEVRRLGSRLHQLVERGGGGGDRRGGDRASPSPRPRDPGSRREPATRGGGVGGGGIVGGGVFACSPRATRRARTTGGGRGRIGKRTSRTMALASSSASSANDPAPSMGSGRRSRALAASCSAMLACRDASNARTSAIEADASRWREGPTRFERASNASSAFARVARHDARTCQECASVCVGARLRLQVATRVRHRIGDCQGPIPTIYFSTAPLSRATRRGAQCRMRAAASAGAVSADAARPRRCASTRLAECARGADVRPFFARHRRTGVKKR